MRIALSVFLLFFMCPCGAGLGQELGSLRAGVLRGDPMQGAKENTEPASQEQQAEKKPLTNDDVISMVKAGLPESTIVLAIQHSSTAFDTSPQALISLQGAGVPQAILNAMLTAGNANQAPPPAPAGQATRHPVSTGGNGKWDVREEVSPDSGSQTVIMSIPAEQEVSALAGLDKYPRLYIRCQSRQTDVYIHMGSLPAGVDANEEYGVRLRLDAGQPSAQPWEQSTNHDSLFAPDPVELARRLAVAKKLTIEFSPPGSRSFTTWFDLTGLGGGLDKVANACGWSVQLESASSTSMKSPPPPLHSIRKVIIDADWTDDDVVMAKKTAAITKHTCLQVVDTLAAADAILKWSIEGFTGGILELRSKDGQVLWSRAGGFNTPLGAMKQALGCPK